MYSLYLSSKTGGLDRVRRQRSPVSHSSVYRITIRCWPMPRFGMTLLSPPREKVWQLFVRNKGTPHTSNKFPEVTWVFFCPYVA